MLDAILGWAFTQVFGENAGSDNCGDKKKGMCQAGRGDVVDRKAWEEMCPLEVEHRGLAHFAPGEPFQSGTGDLEIIFELNGKSLLLEKWKS